MSAGDYKQVGKRLAYTNGSSTTLSVGDVVLLSSIIGVVIGHDIAYAASGVVQVSEVFELTKTSGQTWVVGQQLYWNATTSALTTTAGANKKAGTAAAAAGSSDTTGLVNLNLNG